MNPACACRPSGGVRPPALDSCVNSSVQVASPPARPLLLYDGDCDFCSLWIHRWRQTAGDRLDYLPFQHPSVAARFPEVPRARCAAAVQLVETDGRVYGGAEAVFRAFAHKPRRGRLLHWYQRSPAFARASEWAYRLVARHRRFGAVLTRLAIHPRRPFDKTAR